MSFTLHFNSNKNKDKLNTSELEALIHCPVSVKFDSIIFDIHFNQVINQLPSFIKKVELGHYFSEDISNIGNHVETIIFQCVEFNYDLSTFPKGLKNLFIGSDKISSRIENFNSELKKLNITSSSFNEEIRFEKSNLVELKIMSNAFNQSLEYLPSSLKSLDIICSHFNLPLDNLPKDLECLKISSTIFNQPLTNLPLGLKTLTITDGSSFRQSLHNLPDGLENLTLNLGYQDLPNLYTHTLEHLPSSLIKLELTNYWGDLNTLGDNIVELDIWFPPNISITARTHIQHWHKLPKSLKILNINKDLARLNQIHNIADIISSNFNLTGIIVNDISN
jgi:hypothetical protein